MKSRITYLLGLALFILACNEETPVREDPQFQADLIAKLVVADRYWRVEEVIVVKGSDSTLLQAPPHSPDSLGWKKIRSYQFADDHKFENVDQRGIFGNLKYSDQHSLETGSIYRTNPPGGWWWDEEKGTIAVEGMIPVEDASGYLDKKWLPAAKNLTEAMALGKPERIRIVFPSAEVDGQTATYVYCLRAAWFIEETARDRDKIVIYRTLY